MKRIRNVLVIIGLILIFPNLAKAYSESNLVVNPGFEIGTTIPLNWTLVSHNGNTPVWSNINHDGSKSIEIKIPGTTDLQSGYPVSDLIIANPSETYTVRAWGKTESTGGLNTPAIRVVELDLEKNWIRQNNLPVFGRGTNDWIQKELEFQTSSNTAFLYIYANIWNGYGTFWMDDVELTLKNGLLPDPTYSPSPAPVVTSTPAQTAAPVPAPIPSQQEVVIAFASDAETVGYPGESEEIKDLNAMLQLSPTGSLNAIVFAGDMSILTDAKTAIGKSNMKNVPYYFAVGNHEAESSQDIYTLKSSLPDKFPLNPGPVGSEKTTYSFDVGNFHIAVINSYWDGKTNERYMKYGDDDGGWIPDKLMTWIDQDLNKTNKPFKIVVFHDPLYPIKNHVGDSLDADKENRDRLQSIMEKNKVSLVVAGHTQYAYLEKKGTIWHSNTGGFGTHMHGKYDKFASVIYAYSSGSNMKVTWKHENPTWSSPWTKTQTITPPNE